jgi:glyceraldehyde-3-phosphate dehydrogenase/erythrose-4-phosphate dehydrogenase
MEQRFIYHGNRKWLYLLMILIMLCYYNTGALLHMKLWASFSFKGADKVLTVSGKRVPNIVHGVNQNEYNPDEIIFRYLTTNAITPILKAKIL